MNIPTNLIPRSDLSLAQRMLATGAAPDLIVQAIDEGLFDGVDLNKTIETIPLSEMWARKTVLPSPMIYESFESKMGVIPDLDWPVDTDPSQIRTIGERKEGDESWVNQAMEVLWVEHAAIRLVKSGMDPLQPWSINKKAWQTHYENLLDWASKTGRPWLLKTCLESLHSEVRTLEAKRSVYGPNSRKEEVIGTRLHEAMNHHLPLVAEVWRQAGADIHARNSTGETPIFLARSCHAIEWALKHGANLGDISNEGAAPQDAWRKRAINVEEWSRMTKVAKLSEGETLALLGKTISRGDLDGFKKSFDSLKDASLATLPGGHTLIGHAAREFILGNTHLPPKEQWRKSMNKILHFLWSRVDLEAAHSNRTNPFLTDRDIAWVASMMLGGLAGRAAKSALKKHGFSAPSLESTLQWGAHVFSVDHAPAYSRPWSNLRNWAVFAAGKRATKGTMDEVQVANFIKILNETAETGSSSASESIATATLTIPTIVKQRDGDIQMDQEVKNRLFVELVRASCRAISEGDYVNESFTERSGYENDSLSGFRKIIQQMRPDSVFIQDGDRSLASCITALLDMGAVFPEEEYEFLRESVEDSRMMDHPTFKEIEPLLTLYREEEMKRGIPESNKPFPSRKKSRF